MFGTLMPPSVEHSGRFGSVGAAGTHAAFVADTEGRVLDFVYTQIADAGHCAANIAPQSGHAGLAAWLLQRQ